MNESLKLQILNIENNILSCEKLAQSAIEITNQVLIKEDPLLLTEVSGNCNCMKENLVDAQNLLDWAKDNREKVGNLLTNATHKV